MRQTLKVSLSLLITLLAFAIFLVVAYTGFFSFIETGFFQPRVQNEYSKQLEAIGLAIDEYHKKNIERFSPIVKKDFVSHAFLSQQSEEDIFNRENFFGKLTEDFTNLEFVRFLGPGGKKIHFSTLSSDIRKEDKYRKVYYNLKDVDTSILGTKLVTSAEEKYKILIDGKNQRFIYSFAVIDSFGVYRGSILFYIAKIDLDNYLIGIPGLSFKSVVLLGDTGIVVNYPVEKIGLLKEELESIWQTDEDKNIKIIPFAFKTSNDSSIKYLLFTKPLKYFGKIALIVPVERFQIQIWMKIILSASLFMTLFLFIYLIFNLRQDPMVILSERIKRFQIDFLQEFIESKEKVNWEKWQHELKLKRNDVKGRIKQGIGRISKKQVKEVDDIIDKSWNEIISVIGQKIETQPKEEKVDLKRIEDMIQRAITNGRFVVSAPPQAVGEVSQVLKGETGKAADLQGSGQTGLQQTPQAVQQGAAPGTGIGAGAGARRPIEVEEIDEEEVEELEEVEETGEVEKTAEEHEEVEELEEVEEAGEAEEVEEPEEVEELEEVEEAGEAEKVEEPEEVEELEEVEEAGEAEEVEEPEEVEELEEVEEAGEAEEVEEPEELESVPEIEELPPEPEEENLEELPVLEDTTEIETLKNINKKVDEKGIEAMKGGKQEYSNEHKEKPVEEQELREKKAETAEEVEELEEVEEAGEAVEVEEPEEVEELEEAEEAPEEVEELESVEELEGVGELETAELQEEPETKAQAWSSEQEAADFEALIKSNKIEIYTINELKGLVEKYKHAIVSKNGVYTIKEELFNSENKKQKEKDNTNKEKEKTGEGGDLLSIGDLFGDKENEDLFKDVSSHEGQKSKSLADRQKKLKILPLTNDGINWDEYLKFFARPFSDVTQVKALVEVSRSVQAVSCAIMIKEKDYFIPDITIGLSDNSQAIFRIAENDSFGKSFLKDKLTVICNTGLKDIKYFSNKFADEDMPYFKRAVFFPAVYKSTSALLFFAFSRDNELGIKELINRFNIV